MMFDTGSVTAIFDGNEFILTDRSTNLKEPPAADFPLLTYLNYLGQYGWMATAGRFEGWSVMIDLEKPAEPGEKISSYMLVMLHQVSGPAMLLSSVAETHVKLFGELQQVREREGWQVLVGPKHLSSRKGMWTVSLWVK
jgi:hypothetical protein